MKHLAQLLASVTIGLLMMVSVPDVSAGASSAAESACMVAVNSNYGGKVKNLEVVSSEFSQANSEVIIDADGEQWRCLVSNDGKVEDLSVMESQASGNSSRGASSNAESACMQAVNRNYGGKVENLDVISSEFSQANSEVIIDADGERWRCLVSEDGKVQDLSVQ